MHQTPTEASGSFRASGSSSDELQKLDRLLKLLTGLISQSNKEGYEQVPSQRLKASIGTALLKYVMRYAPEDSPYFNRDRLVVSGHYAGRWKGLFEHLIAAKGIAVGLPDIASSAIGQAIALKNLTMLYNKPDLELLDNMIWCIIDDPKFHQGSALDAVALAGNWKLRNLCVIYDSTYDSISNNLEVNNFKTHGWDVIKLVNEENLTIASKFYQGASRDD
ncbi:transketolase [Fusarium globosum]|uniref:Transketolase n=1 Tax=Fusarium globosum TaxID=78864 RepID=A0A8H6CXS3_9HYPO|nr:transketolase [Fusarium globosum]